MASQTHLMEGQLENRAEWGVTPHVLAELLSRTTAVRSVRTCFHTCVRPRTRGLRGLRGLRAEIRCACGLGAPI